MDINRVIMESIQSVLDDKKEDVIKEETAFGKKDVVEKTKEALKAKPGTAFGGPKTEDIVTSPDDPEGYVTPSISPTEAGKVDLASMGKKGAWAASAIAAGLGALALAKKLRGTKKGKVATAKA